MRKTIILILAVLLLLCMTSCEDTPTLESGTAAFKETDSVSVEETDTVIPEESESETKSSVSWTPFV